MEENKLIVFQEKAIRRTWHNEEWYFSVSDVVGVLSESKDPKAYWRKLKQRENQLVTLCHGLKLPAKDGKMRKEDCSNLPFHSKERSGIASLKIDINIFSCILFS